MSFVNLHGHSHYSLLDGFGSPADIVARAKELGYPAAALTDHGVGYGLIEFYKAAKAAGMTCVGLQSDSSLGQNLAAADLTVSSLSILNTNQLLSLA